jgi:hypothetical protein
VDDGIDGGRRVQQLVAGHRQLAGDGGAQHSAGAGHVHAAEAQLVHRQATVGRRA